MSDLVQVTLPDGSQKQAPRGTTVLDFVRSAIGAGLAKAAYFAKLDGQPVDLSRKLESDAKLEVVTTKSPEALEVARHDAAHVMASVVQKLYPGTQVTIGPAIEDGFYYDFAREKPFTPGGSREDREGDQRGDRPDLPFVREEISMAGGARALRVPRREVQGRDRPGHRRPGAKTLTLYQHGDWVDFCLGPHGPSTGRIGVVKLLNVAGAYWRGDAKNAMLQRIYGTAFFDKKALDAHLTKLEEVKKRDHRPPRTGARALRLPRRRPGLGVLAARTGPRSTTCSRDAMRRLVSKNGYQEVKTPLLFNKKLWEPRGHWGVYKENMFLVSTRRPTPPCRSTTGSTRA